MHFCVKSIIGKPFRVIIYTLLCLIGATGSVNVLASMMKLTYCQAEEKPFLNLYVFQHYERMPEILVFGSSRTQVGVFPTVLADELRFFTHKEITSYNLGQFGGTIYIDYTILRNLLNGRYLPKIILLGVDDRGFNSYGPARDNFIQYYADPFDLLLKLEPSDYLRDFDLIARGFFRDFSNILLLPRMNPAQEECQGEVARLLEQKGARYFSENLANRKGRDSLLKKEINGHREWMSNYQIGGLADKSFRAFIVFCKKRRIELICFQPPLQEVIVEQCEHYPIFLKYITATCDSNGIEFHDLQNLDLDDSDYVNFTHLNVQGARKLSAYIAKQILAKKLRRFDAVSENASVHAFRHLQ